MFFSACSLVYLFPKVHKSLTFKYCMTVEAGYSILDCTSFYIAMTLNVMKILHIGNSVRTVFRDVQFFTNFLLLVISKFMVNVIKYIEKAGCL